MHSTIPLLLKLSGPHEIDSEFFVFLTLWSNLNRNHVFCKGLIALPHKTTWAWCLSPDLLQPFQGASALVWKRAVRAWGLRTHKQVSSQRIQWAQDAAVSWARSRPLEGGLWLQKVQVFLSRASIHLSSFDFLHFLLSLCSFPEDTAPPGLNRGPFNSPR